MSKEKMREIRVDNQKKLGFYNVAGNSAVFAAESNAVNVLLAATKSIQIGGIALILNLPKRSVGTVIHIFRFFTSFYFNDNPCAFGSNAVIKNDVGETVAGFNVGSQIFGIGTGATKQSG